jgi:hypothetical protein
MRTFAIEHRFAGVDCDAYEALFFDEAFWAALGRELRLGRELLKLERTEARIVRHVRCAPDQDPNTPEGKALADNKASFVEELDYDRRARRGEWRTIPWLLPERVRTRGTIEIAPAPGGGVRRLVRGEVDARLWGFGGLVERRAVVEIEKSYATAAMFTNAWLARAR